MNVHWNLREKLKLRRLTYDVACSRICKTLIDNTFLIIICFWTVNWNDFQIYQNIIWKEIIFIKKINFFQGYSAWLGYIFISIKTTQVIFVYRNNGDIMFKTKCQWWKFSLKDRCFTNRKLLCRIRVLSDRWR